MTVAGHVGEIVVAGASGTALLIALQTALNAVLLRRPDPAGEPVAERVSVLVPLRDEALRVEPCLRALLASEGVPVLEVLVLDDGSRDFTASVVEAVVDGDLRVRQLVGAPLPPGWLGKPHACHQLALAASGDVLVFLDADVVLAADGLARSVQLLRSRSLDLVSPYPRQACAGALRLVQPLLQWLWLALVPLRIAERSGRESLAVANGQLLVVDASAYWRAGGHATVRGEVLEDVGLLRAVLRSGGHGTVVDGTALAACRMYDSWPELVAGYTKSLWSAGGSRVASAAQMGALLVVFVLPFVAMVLGSVTGAVGYGAGVASRVISGRRTGAQVVPDALAHPASVLVLGWLTARSWRARSAGRIEWKGRSL